MQEKSTPLFPDIEWNKPERQNQAGRLGIIGGSSFGFAVMAESFRAAREAGAGEIRMVLPDTLKKSLSPVTTDALFAPTNISGGLAIEALSAAQSLAAWADCLLLPGDAGKNSQTAVLYETLLANSQRPTVVTRDAIDVVQGSIPTLLDNPQLVFVASFAQIQKIFRAVYYPKVLTFSMQLAQFVEALHKFTITHPVTIVSFHAEQLVVAHGGEVVTQRWTEPMQIWRGITAARIASYLLWTPQAPLKATVASLL